MLSQSQLQHFLTSDGERKLSCNFEDGRIDLNMAEDLLGSPAVVIIRSLQQDIKTTAEEYTGQQVKQAGSIVSWLSPPTREWEKPSKEAKYNYSTLHCDKANHFEYDISCVLYLNNEFTGGEFVFVDEIDESNHHEKENKQKNEEEGNGELVNWLMPPKEGRLLMFHSSLENIHRVNPVVQGDRLSLAVWFSLV
mmetsp:Transcript_2803/g.3901  ORF Transcript_2803/g.3901 Transcript_2803/m.3901 type:complete len:194 (+) Transcript_2803:147-728(+)